MYRRPPVEVSSLGSLEPAVVETAPRFGRFGFAIARRCVGDERIEQFARRLGDVGDGMLESGFVRFGWMGESAEFAYELNRRRANLVFGSRRRKVMERFDIAAHALKVFRLGG